MRTSSNTHFLRYLAWFQIFTPGDLKWPSTIRVISPKVEYLSQVHFCYEMVYLGCWYLKCKTFQNWKISPPCSCSCCNAPKLHYSFHYPWRCYNIRYKQLNLIKIPSWMLDLSFTVPQQILIIEVDNAFFCQ